MDFKKIADSKSIREMMVAVFYYASSSIFGPLLVFGGLGYLIDNFFDTNPTFLIVGVFVAFVTTNILFVRSSRIFFGKAILPPSVIETANSP